MKKLFIIIYLKIIRKITSPIFYLISRIKYGKLPDKWESVKNLSMEKFSEMLLSYPYKSDPFFGAIDYSLINPNYFFIEKDYGRDCDDFARMWWLWAIHNKKTPVYEVVIVERTKITSAHVITIIKESENKYLLFDYKPVGVFSSIEECAKNNIVGIKDPMIFIYKKKLK